MPFPALPFRKADAGLERRRRFAHHRKLPDGSVGFITGRLSVLDRGAEAVTATRCREKGGGRPSRVARPNPMKALVSVVSDVLTYVL